MFFRTKLCLLCVKLCAIFVVNRSSFFKKHDFLNISGNHETSKKKPNNISRLYNLGRDPVHASSMHSKKSIRHVSTEDNVLATNLRIQHEFDWEGSNKATPLKCKRGARNSRATSQPADAVEQIPATLPTLVTGHILHDYFRISTALLQKTLPNKITPRKCYTRGCQARHTQCCALGLSTSYFNSTHSNTIRQLVFALNAC